jgi:hypothetical protein
VLTLQGFLFPYLPAMDVNDVQALACKINEEFVAHLMRNTHDVSRIR